ncbi:MAG: DUF805 domain-containing protein [Klebsiella michiganensis]|nr:DUF805 domain-containing protein [Klebsiella michiganensis]
MTLQQWLFSIKGRIGRRDFWIWIAIWIMTMSALFTLAGSNLLNLQTAAFILVCLLWPTAAVTIKRLHDRGKSGFIPTLIIVMMLIDLGAFVGTQGANKFGKETLDVRWKAES